MGAILGIFFVCITPHASFHRRCLFHSKIRNPETLSDIFDLSLCILRALPADSDSAEQPRTGVRKGRTSPGLLCFPPVPKYTLFDLKQAVAVKSAVLINRLALVVGKFVVLHHRADIFFVGIGTGTLAETIVDQMKHSYFFSLYVFYRFLFCLPLFRLV